MVRKNRQDIEIIRYILREVENHPNDIVSWAATNLGKSRMTVNRYLGKLVKDKVLTATGRTKAREYKLYETTHRFSFPITKQSQEDVIWREKILPLLVGVKTNIVGICEHGITEMINNVIDHSDSKECSIEVRKSIKRIVIKIHDFGVGIFEKIRKDCHLDDLRHALLELSKGKLTTDPANHSGEGIFFTSRMFSEFTISSGTLYYEFSKKTGDWLFELEDHHKHIVGTLVRLEINTNVDYTTADVFNEYSDEEFNFSKTHVPLKLARYGKEQFISRSQARRVLARFDRFSEVILDFKDIQEIGQAFADEIFRVFKNKHPEINIYALNTSSVIDAMIKRVQNAAQAPGLLDL